MAGDFRDDAVASEPTGPGAPSRAVRIESRAGSLTAVKDYLESLPPDSDCVLIVAGHGADTDPGVIVEMLAGVTSLRVIEAASPIALSPGTVIVVPSPVGVQAVGARTALADVGVQLTDPSASPEAYPGAFTVLSLIPVAESQSLLAANAALHKANVDLEELAAELRARTSELQRINGDLDSIQSSLSQGIVIVDADLRVTRFTPLAVRVFDLAESDVGRPILAVPTAVDIPGLVDAIGAVLRGGGRRTISARGGGLSYLVQVLPCLAADDGPPGAVVTLTDVSELDGLRAMAEVAIADLQAKSALLAQRSAYDAVTGLLNRRYFTDALELELARATRSGSRLALASIDLDRFKEVNDEYGQDVGDATLKAIGERIASVVGATDPVGRMGSDEFAVVISGYETSNELDMLLDFITIALREPIAVNGTRVGVSGCVGVAIFEEDESTAEGLIRASVAAMHEAKRRGGAGYEYFDATMNAAADDRRRMRADIALAVEQAEFEMHYQPILETSLERVWGVEALMRWRRGEEIVSAGDFVPFCEDSGQIREVGEVSLNLIRHDLARLHAAGHSGLSISVNMSVSQLEEPRLVELLEAIPPSGSLRGVAVEIVESIFLPDHDVALTVLHGLAARGADLSIDDYGAGYSNVRLLEALSPAYLKLDRSFVSDQHTEDARHALVRSVVELSHVIGAKIVAEGIEDLEQCRSLRDAGVDFVQGHAIARPMPLDQLIEWLDTRAPAPDSAASGPPSA